MAANQALINVASKVAQSKGFNLGFEQAAANLQKWGEVVEKQLVERKKNREKSDAKVAKYMDQIPEGGSIAKIPLHAREGVAEFLSKGRDKYAVHANSIRDLDPQDMEYQNHVTEMNKIIQSFDNLDKQLSSLLDNKVKYLEDKDEFRISYGTNPDAYVFLANLYTDEVGISISTEGSLLFGEDGITMQDIPKYIETNTLGQKAIARLIATKESAGKEITNDVGLRLAIEVIVDEEGRSGLLSLAADNPVNDQDSKGLGLSDDLLYNPENNEKLREIVINSYMNMVKASAKAAADRKAEATLQSRKDRIADRKPTAAKNELDTLWAIPIDPTKQ